MRVKRLAQIFGFDKQKAWWYRDLALTTIAAIMTLWVVIALMEPESSFNWRLAVGAGAIAMLCLALTPNRLMLFGAVIGILAVQSWFAVLVSGNHRGLWVAVPATLLVLGLLLKYRSKPMIRK
jgi:hypothetical protein